MNKRKTILFLGCGDIGLRTAALLHRRGFVAIGLRRQAAGLPSFVRPVAADYTRAEDLACLERLAPDYVIATPLPTARSADGYRRGYTGAIDNLLSGLGGHRPRFTLLVSSTRVYAERAGGWVEEDSPLEEREPRALAIVEAERSLLGSGLPGAVVRCGGIYGKPGGRLLQRLATGAVCPPEPPRYTNRIHREDCAGFLAHLIERAASGRPVVACYNAVDDCPAPQHEVESWLCRALGIEPRITGPVSETGHKRCRNTRLHESGYRLRYPDYRAGYGALLAL